MTIPTQKSIPTSPLTTITSPENAFPQLSAKTTGVANRDSWNSIIESIQSSTSSVENIPDLVEIISALRLEMDLTKQELRKTKEDRAQALLSISYLQVKLDIAQVMYEMMEKEGNLEQAKSKLLFQEQVVSAARLALDWERKWNQVVRERDETLDRVLELERKMYMQKCGSRCI